MVVKGNGSGIWEAIGNTSAPWWLLPFVGGAVAGGRLSRAAFVGIMAALAALGSFYVTNSFVVGIAACVLVLSVTRSRRTAT